MYTANDETRNGFVTGLRQLADYLDANPEVPVPRWADIAVHADYLEDGGREQVNQIADALGTGIDPHSSDTHYRTAQRNFGHINYYAIAISGDEMARYEALHSYNGCVTPDQAA